MAGDWIKIEHVTPDKPEVYTIAEVLDLDPDTVAGKLLRLWIWADQQSISGNALTVTEKVIDRITHQSGFSSALRKVGWLEVRSGSLQLPNFDRHNGQTSKNRAVANERVAKHRNKRNKPDVSDVTHEPLQKPLPEKRREEDLEEREIAREREYARQAETIVGNYPRREKQVSAMQIVVQHLKEGESYKAMLSGTKACAAVIKTMPSGANNRYVPGAEAFFLNKRWKDDPKTLNRSGSGDAAPGQMSLDEAASMLGRRVQPLDE